MSSPTTTPTLPVLNVTAEVWLHICEELVGEDGYASRVLPLLCVCRQWKDMFMPAFYRHLRINHPSAQRFDRLCFRLASCDLTGNPVGSWCQSLVIDPDSIRTTIVSLPTLFLYLPNLRSFSTLPGCAIKAFDLDALTRSCKDSLRSLSVQLAGAGGLGGLGLGFISRLTRLVHLSITVNWNGDSAIFSVHDAAPGFNMPSLKSLSWCAVGEPIRPYLSFLSRCQFPSIERLELSLPSLRVEMVPVLAPFLDRYFPQVSRLELIKPPMARTLCALLQSLVPEHLTLIPPALPEIMMILPDILGCVRHLHLLLEPKSPVIANQICDLLNAMHTSDDSRLLTDVHLQLKDGSRFLWTDIHHIPSDLAVRLVRAALILADRGIPTRDARGKGIMLL